MVRNKYSGEDLLHQISVRRVQGVSERERERRKTQVMAVIKKSQEKKVFY